MALPDLKFRAFELGHVVAVIDANLGAGDALILVGENHVAPGPDLFTGLVDEYFFRVDLLGSTPQADIADEVYRLTVFTGDGLRFDAGFIECDVVVFNELERWNTAQAPVFLGGDTGPEHSRR